MLLELTKSVQSGIRQERQYEVIANHLANADTTGFKGDILTFDDMMKAKITTDLRPGDLKETGNALDMAIAEKGFFKIQTPNGVRYTRNGNFMLNLNSQLVTQTGDLVLSNNEGPLVITGKDVTVHENGGITSDGENIGTLGIVDFTIEGTLEKDGNSYFKHMGQPGEEVAAQNILVKQGALETANVSTVKEMTKMIESHRKYETIQKLIHSFDELDAKVNEVGRPL